MVLSGCLCSGGEENNDRANDNHHDGNLCRCPKVQPMMKVELKAKYEFPSCLPYTLGWVVTAMARGAEELYASRYVLKHFANFSSTFRFFCSFLAM